jgi:lipopolysaccharide/colanic/teichoic acid biosynthesis glycosyltransferase
MYKIRSMRCDAEVATGPVWAQLSDPRATRLGAILRKLHLDELPQLVNVLRGEMSLVGPRPERPEFTRKLSQQIPGYLKRLHVRPGITGLAQINLPPDCDTDSVRRKLALDSKYVSDASLWLDMRILLATSFCPFGPLAASARRWFGVHHEVSQLGTLEDADSGRANGDVKQSSRQVTV